MPKPEQTERATPKRREEARERGQVTRSQELGGAAIFLVTVLVLHAFYMRMVLTLEASATGGASSVAQRQHYTYALTWLLFECVGFWVGFILAIVFAIAMVVGIVVNVVRES